MTERTFTLLLLWLGLVVWIAWGAVFVVSWALHGHGVDLVMSLVSAWVVTKVSTELREMRMLRLRFLADRRMPKEWSHDDDECRHA